LENIRYMISDAANMVNVESHVLRYWEEELELEIPRNELGHRYYTEENIRDFLRIKQWKEQGYQLKAIRMLVQEEKLKDVPRGRVGTGELIPQDRGPNSKMTNNSADKSTKLEQFQIIMTNIVRNALEENNQALSKEVGYQIQDKVIKEMNYLMREQDEAEEERFRKLDAAIRAKGKLKKMKMDKPSKDKRFHRKERKLNPNLSM